MWLRNNDLFDQYNRSSNLPLTILKLFLHLKNDATKHFNVTVTNMVKPIHQINFLLHCVFDVEAYLAIT